MPSTGKYFRYSHLEKALICGINSNDYHQTLQLISNLIDNSKCDPRKVNIKGHNLLTFALFCGYSTDDTELMFKLGQNCNCFEQDYKNHSYIEYIKLQELHKLNSLHLSLLHN